MSPWHNISVTLRLTFALVAGMHNQMTWYISSVSLILSFSAIADSLLFIGIPYEHLILHCLSSLFILVQKMMS
uniref:Uncharacterized protein n=1 Tax=Rhizophora mucronata TaxID=61149 RepID=A0A2P2PIY5_RHIMU